jgi:hypothetical protein
MGLAGVRLPPRSSPGVHEDRSDLTGARPDPAAAGPAPQCRMILDIAGSLLMTSAMTAC